MDITFFPLLLYRWRDLCASEHDDFERLSDDDDTGTLPEQTDTGDSPLLDNEKTPVFSSSINAESKLKENGRSGWPLNSDL